MKIDLEGIAIIVGNYGSGKTEVAINLAVHRKREGVDVRLADLDLINPYFRTREAKNALKELGIEVVIPPMKYFHADLPILSPEVAGLIRNPNQLTILDAGGDEAGATVLSALSAHFRNKTVRMLQVVNPLRPFTETIEGCITIRERIEAAARIRVTGLIRNANLLGDTEPAHILRGHEFVRELSEKTGVDLVMITCPSGLLLSLDPSRFSCPVLPIERQLVPPWKKAAPII